MRAGRGALEAASRRSPEGYRLRALEARARIGSVTDPERFLDLGIIAHHDPNIEIRRAAGEILFALHPQGRAR